MTVALNSALSGLKVAQQSLDVASRNISNASTDGYTRKILPQETLIVSGKAFGVNALALRRNIDNTVLIALNKQTGLTSASSTRLKYLEYIQDFHGGTSSGRALSSKMTNLFESFAQLSTSPNDQVLLNKVINMASDATRTINDFSRIINQLRSDTESDIITALNDINNASANISKLNQQIEKQASVGQEIADLEDQRDLAVSTISKYMEINTFKTGETLSVITKTGTTIADTNTYPLYLTKSTILPTSYYPGGGINGIRSGSPSGEDITQTNLGGKLGALIDLRDSTLPQYMAQMDEFAQKLAERFDQQGMRLFSDLNGNIPASVPDPGLVGYVGFSQIIGINPAVLNDPTLIRNGTNGGTEKIGSNEVIRRISEFAFGAYQYQEATGAVDISGGGDLVTILGLTTSNAVTGNVNIDAYNTIDEIPNLPLPSSFDLTIGAATQTIALVGTDTAADIVTKINTAFASTVSQINSLGQLQVYNSNSDTITFADNTIGAAGMAALGFSFGATVAPDPSFEVQVGTRAAVTVTIAPADTSVELLTKLNAIPGLTALLDGAGNLVMRPTDGGDLRVTDTVGTPLASMNMTTANVSQGSFRQNNLGPDGTSSTNLLGNSTLIEYISSMITSQSEDHSLTNNQLEQEDSFLRTLESRHQNLSGVNIDEEMSNLIRIQSSYQAAAKMIQVASELLDELIRTF